MGGASGLEGNTIDSIFVETRPFRESGLSNAMVVFVIPIQHVRAILDPDFLAIGFNDARWIVEKIIGINNSDADLAIFQFGIPTGDSRPNLLLLAKKFEEAVKLIVSSLRWHEVIETSDLVERRNRAAPIGWNAVAWMTDQEREVKLLQDLCRYNCGVTELCLSVVRIRSLIATICSAVNAAVVDSIRNTVHLSIGHSICSDALLSGFASEGWRDGCRLDFRRDEVVRNILDEETFALRFVSFTSSVTLL